MKKVTKPKKLLNKAFYLTKPLSHSISIFVDLIIFQAIISCLQIIPSRFYLFIARPF